MRRSSLLCALLFACTSSGSVKPITLDGLTQNAGSEDDGTGDEEDEASPRAIVVFTMPPSKDFGTMPIASYVDAVVTLSNTGAVPATGLAASGLTAPFSLASGVWPGGGGPSACGATLSPAATCDVTLRFSPSAAGSFSDDLQVDYHDGVEAKFAILALAGSGADAGTPSLSFMPGGAYPNDPDAFGSQSADVTHTYLLKNVGTAPSSAITVSLAGTNAGEWQLGSDLCSTATLAAGATCTVQATFRGASGPTGAFTATLQASATSGGTATNALTGTQVTPPASQLAFDQAPSDSFGTGNVDVTHTYTLRNTGVAKSQPITIGKTGTGESRWSIQSNTCNGAQLDPAAFCTVQFQFLGGSGYPGSFSAQAEASASNSPTATVAMTGVAEFHWFADTNNPWGSPSASYDLGNAPTPGTVCGLQRGMGILVKIGDTPNGMQERYHRVPSGDVQNCGGTGKYFTDAVGIAGQGTLRDCVNTATTWTTGTGGAGFCQSLATPDTDYWAAYQDPTIDSCWTMMKVVVITYRCD
ncbi:MAG: choice-of-anchor D domain-containing protein [Deltaproteobacteria bacterium]|nr:choice-of-anchor D domain-containing protein [Deltaproteobacteria bacterium]